MRRFFSACSFLALISVTQTATQTVFTRTAHAGTVEIHSHQLWIDGAPEPQLYGVEIQYFRLGAEARNMPKEEILDRWNKALEHAYSMGANAISVAIPWDFHEIAPGQFDFDGSADEDGDGRADFPARDLRTFFDLVESYGFRHILVRAGPSIGPDWGITGHAAVPEWFHRLYPDSHMQTPDGKSLSAYSYADPRFRAHLEKWLEALFRDVLIDFIGEGRPVSFIELDGENALTRLPLDLADFHPAAVISYRQYLKETYGNIAKLNSAHNRQWESFDSVEPPRAVGANAAEDRDWYLFHEKTRNEFLLFLRRTWERLGVKEPLILFLAAESHESVPRALQPNYSSNKNAYKSPYLLTALDRPFKTDHDVKLVRSANEFYFGSKADWTVATLITHPPTNRPLTSNEHIVSQLSALAEGAKALFIRPFHDGPNWQGAWLKSRISPWFNALRNDPRYAGIPLERLPDTFWNELNGVVASQLFADVDARAVFKLENPGDSTSAPLDGHAQPRPVFDVFREIGDKVIATSGWFLSESVALNDPVCLIHDPQTRLPSPIRTINASDLNQTWSAGLIGLLMESSLNPRILHWGLTPKTEFDSCRLFIVQDAGYASEGLARYLRARATEGAGVISFLNNRIHKELIGFAASCQDTWAAPTRVVFQKCQVGAGYVYHQAEPVYTTLNSPSYVNLNDMIFRRAIITKALEDLNLKPHLEIVPANEESTSHTVAIGRTNFDGTEVFLTVKNAGSNAFRGTIRWTGADPDETYSVTRLLDDVMTVYRGRDLIEKGFFAGVAPEDAEAFVIAPTPLLPRESSRSAR